MTEREEKLLAYCLQKTGAYMDTPFGPESLVVKVSGHIFAQFGCGRDHDLVTFKCSREVGEFYRNQYPGLVIRGWHCPPVQQPYWNSMVAESIPEDELLNMVDHAYTVVIGKLPRREKERWKMQIAGGAHTHET